MGIAVLGIGILALVCASLAGAIGFFYLILLSLIALVVTLARRSPSLAFMALVFVIVVVPPWIYWSVLGVRISAAAGMAVLIILARLGLPVATRFCFADWALVFSLAALSLATSVFDTPVFLLMQVAGEWVLVYCAVRLIWNSEMEVGRILFWIGAALGVVAFAQFMLRFNLADVWPFSFGSLTTPWRSLQERAGSARAEVTLGHSIALGGTLVLCASFAHAERSLLARATGILTITAGIVGSLSRAALLGMVVVLGAVLLFSRMSIMAKIVWLGLLSVVVDFAVGAFSDATSGSAGAEVRNGTEYRAELLSLVRNVNIVGLGSNPYPGAYPGTFRWGQFYSIDNGLLYLALYGGMAFVCGLTGVLLYSLSRGGLKRGLDGPRIALCAQIPLILAVAPITQYQSIFWIVVSVGVSAGVHFEDKGLPPARGPSSSPADASMDSLIDSTWRNVRVIVAAAL